MSLLWFRLWMGWTVLLVVGIPISFLFSTNLGIWLFVLSPGVGLLMLFFRPGVNFTMACLGLLASLKPHQEPDREGR